MVQRFTSINSDDGRLGLEITDPNNKEVGIEQPLLKAYKEIIHDEYFSPVFTKGEEITFPAKLRWGGSRMLLAYPFPYS